MKIKQFQRSLILVLLFSSLIANGQELWRKLDTGKNTLQKKEIRSFKNLPAEYTRYQFALDQFESSANAQFKASSNIIYLPNSAGSLDAFKVKLSSNFENSLAVKYPTIKSYTGIGITNPDALAKISIGTDGFHAVIFTANGKTIYIDPYSLDNQQYIVYKTSDLKEQDVLFRCEVEENVLKQSFVPEQLSRFNDGNLRTYRLALVCSGEYAQFHLNNQGVDATASDADKKTAVLSAMNTSMTRVNGVFEKDLAVKMLLVGNNDNVIFLDSQTDNITDGDPSAMISEVQTIADTQIGDANYDIGHIFSIGGSGLAGLGVVCLSGQKARGVTGRPSPIGDPYDIDYVAHEMGHQFGATHTQNNDCNRTNSTAIEPGSASTIMGYAGICAPNVQNVSDAYFHAVSITQMQANIAGSASCATLVSNGNTAPIADAGFDYSIPKSTPFILKGAATDTGDIAALTYNWEQIDNEIAAMPPVATSTGGPMFRSLPSSVSPNRYMPALETIISGATSTTWEVLPSVSRELNFSLLVRDNNGDGGANSMDVMKVVVEDTEAFTVTSQNTGSSWIAGSAQTISWNIGTTDITPINCQNVVIKLSQDGGVTFPIILVENTPNDGSEEVVMPEYVTTQARIMVAAADNIFYNVNSTNFEILSTEPTFIFQNTSGAASACNAGNQSADYTLNLDFINDFQEEVSFEVTGQPEGAIVVFNPTTVSADSNIIMSISNLDAAAAQEYSINIQGNSTSVTQNITVNLSVVASNLDAVILTSPSDGAEGVSLGEILTWQETLNASSYLIEISANAVFTDIISSGTSDTNQYLVTNLEGTTMYYWRVKSKNNCTESSFSTVFSFTTAVPSYCTSTFIDENGVAEFDYIMNVTFNGINNDSDNELTTSYQDFTYLNTRVLRGGSRDVSVTFDTDGYQSHCYVFIDWNQDFIFDKSTERYDLGSKTEDVAIATLAINVPLDAKFGTTRMRVVVEYDDPTTGFGDGPCEGDHLWGYGETEDYSITVVAPVLDSDNYSVTSIDESRFKATDGEINIGIKQDEFSYELTIVGPSTNISTALVGINEYRLKERLPGVYTVCLKALEVGDTQCFELDIEQGEMRIDADNYEIKSTSETCNDQNDGRIDIAVKQEEYTYQLKINGPETNIDEPLTEFMYSLSDLSPGTYEVCIVVNESNQTDCFEILIIDAELIALKGEPGKSQNKYSFKIDKGTAPFRVFLNDKLLLTSSENNFEIELNKGGKLEIRSAKECEGAYTTSIDDVLLWRNPVGNFIDLLLPLGTEKAEIETIIFDNSGKLVFKQMVSVENNAMSIPFQNFAKGIYILKLSIAAKPIKILKK